MTLFPWASQCRWIGRFSAVLSRNGLTHRRCSIHSRLWTELLFWSCQDTFRTDCRHGITPNLLMRYSTANVSQSTLCLMPTPLWGSWLALLKRDGGRLSTEPRCPHHDVAGTVIQLHPVSWRVNRECPAICLDCRFHAGTNSKGPGWPASLAALSGRCLVKTNCGERLDMQRWWLKRVLASHGSRSRDDLPMDDSIALHKYNQELSGCAECCDPTSTVRTIAKIMVMTTKENILPSASFLRHLIWTPRSILTGMNMTATS